MKKLTKKDIDLYLNFDEVTAPFLETDYVLEKVMYDFEAKQKAKIPNTKLHSLFNWIDAKMKYEREEKFNSENKFARTAKQIWESGKTTGCTDYAILFMTFAKQLGIPTTMLHTASRSWVANLQETKKPTSNQGHNFNECFYDNKWVLVDPTCRKVIEKYNPNQILLSYEVGGENTFVAFDRTVSFERTNIKQYNKNMDITCYKLKLLPPTPNSVVLKDILNKLEKHHINLYHDITKQELTDYINTIPNIDSLSQKQFDIEMLKLFAKFKDAHTRYFTKYKKLSHQLLHLNGKLYVRIEDKYIEIKMINSTPASKVIDTIIPLIPHETNEWLSEKITELINNGVILDMLGLFESERLNLTMHDDTHLVVTWFSPGNKTTIKPSNEKYDKQNIKIETNNNFHYGFKLLENNILHIWYRKCFEVPEYPFENFVQDIDKVVSRYNVSKYILDIKDNAGGNSEIINPLQDYIASKNMTGAMLINNAVFSSGRFAVAKFKKAFGITLIGQGTGGAAKSYGYNQNLETYGKTFSCSIRLWDFSEIFGSEGSIQPDIYVERKIEDINNNVNAELNAAIEYLKNK
ncbi:MAG: transglutaminase domain-containing protein [Clostridia bacterium]|nr:transglutaminase domain-containing protein [Clostridia bacterium]